MYEEVKEITNPYELAYVLTQDSEKLRKEWRTAPEGQKPSNEERSKRAIDHWMKTHPEASWLLLARHLERYIHGDHESAAKKLLRKLVTSTCQQWRRR